MHLITIYYPNYISHHGILGQKWGVRRYQNKDGTYTDAGLKRRQKETAKTLKKDAKYVFEGGSVSYSEKLKRRAEVGKKYAEDEKIGNCLNKLKECTKELDEYYNNQEVFDKYSAMAGYISARRSGITDPEEIRNSVWFYKCEDGDQGTGNSAELFLLDKGISPNDYSKRYMDAVNELRDVSLEYVNNELGSYSPGRVPSSKYGNDTLYQRADEFVAEAAQESANINSPWGVGYMRQEDEARYKELLADAKKNYKKYDVDENYI